MALVNSLRAMRTKRRLTLRALEQMSQVSRAEIGNIETGNAVPRLDTALMLCGALGCAVEDVFALR